LQIDDCRLAIGGEWGVYRRTAEVRRREFRSASGDCGTLQSQIANLQSAISCPSFRPSPLPSFRLISPPHRPHPPTGIALVSGEYGRQLRGAEVSDQHLPEEVAEVGGDGEIPAVFPLLRREGGPAAMHLAAIRVSAEYQHRGCPAVVGAAVAVLRHGAAELAHGEHHDVRHSRAQVPGEGRDRPAEIPQSAG